MQLICTVAKVKLVDVVSVSDLYAQYGAHGVAAELATLFALLDLTHHLTQEHNSSGS